MLNRIGSLLRHYGYAIAETTHDCGEVGGLAQSRKRFLLVARHQAKVPPFLYEPPKRALHAVDDVLGRLPLPGDIERTGPMHRVLSLQWQTWVRLAFVKAESDWRSLNRLRVEDGVIDWNRPSGTIAGESLPSNDTFAVADPRPNLQREPGDAYLTGGHYGVVPWNRPTGAVSAAGQHDNGGWSVADPRMPAATDRLIAVIRSTDNCWHRPFTTLELAALQNLVDPEEQLELHGLSDADWRERIGNAVPPDAAAAIASIMGTTLLLAWSGSGFMLSALPIWVQLMAVALSVRQAGD